MSEKTEKPTPRRLEEARKKGQFGRSRLLSASFVFLGGLLGLLFSLESTASQLLQWAKWLLVGENVTPSGALHDGVSILMKATLPVLLGAFLGGVVSSVATTGFTFNPQLLAFDLKRVSMASGMKRLFSLQPWTELGKSFLVAIVLTFLVWKAVRQSSFDVFQAVSLPAEGALAEVYRPFWDVLFVCAVLLVLLGVGDLWLARRRHIKELMMSREEVKREFKSTEGDPEIKAQRRERHRQLALAGVARGVKAASAVVVNPTHVAVALRYIPEESDAPYIVAKGQEGDALALRRQAESLKIPVVRDIALARSLIHYDVGEEVPEELYQAAAAVLKVAFDAAASKGNIA